MRHKNSFSDAENKTISFKGHRGFLKDFFLQRRFNASNQLNQPNRKLNFELLFNIYVRNIFTRIQMSIVKLSILRLSI